MDSTRPSVGFFDNIPPGMRSILNLVHENDGALNEDAIEEIKNYQVQLSAESTEIQTLYMYLANKAFVTYIRTHKAIYTALYEHLFAYITLSKDEVEKINLDSCRLEQLARVELIVGEFKKYETERCT